jgi:hypothetical protein
MAEFPSSALPGGVEWLSTLGGARLLRIPAGPGDAPALILRTGDGEEHRIEPGPEARFSRHIGYLVPSGMTWSVGLLLWPPGATHAARGDHRAAPPPAGRANAAPRDRRRLDAATAPVDGATIARYRRRDRARARARPGP